MDEDEPSYRVVVNGEGHYSIWAVGKDVPPGWSDTGWEGNKTTAMERIKWLTYKPLPPEYVEFIKLQRESADRDAIANGRKPANWQDPEEERLRFMAEAEKRRQRGE